MWCPPIRYRPSTAAHCPATPHKIRSQIMPPAQSKGKHRAPIQVQRCSFPSGSDPCERQDDGAAPPNSENSSASLVFSNSHISFTITFQLDLHMILRQVRPVRPGMASASARMMPHRYLPVETSLSQQCAENAIDPPVSKHKPDDSIDRIPSVASGYCATMNINLCAPAMAGSDRLQRYQSHALLEIVRAENGFDFHGFWPTSIRRKPPKIGAGLLSSAADGTNTPTCSN